MPDPSEYENENDWMGVCVPKMIKEGKGQDQAVAACMSMWKNKGEEKSDSDDMQQDFLFVELSTISSELKYIDGLAAGTFTAMNGREVSFSNQDLPEYVANTMAIINSTTTEKGEVVGLPIDKDGHDHKGGAGWIVGLELDTTRNIIKFIVKWTKEGIDLIKGNVRRFFSPSADPNDKIILGGSLTNWPATRGAKGQMLLRPVELSQNIKEIDMEKTLAELQAENDILIAKLAQGQAGPAADFEVAELNDWMESNGAGLEELSRQAQQKAELVIKAERRKDKAVEFAAKIIGGTREKPFGLPVKSTRMVKLLLSLPEKQAEEVQELIGLIYKNAIDFAEHGYSAEATGMNFKPKLPAEFAEALHIWVDSGKRAKDWFAEMGDTLVGKAEDWNLTEFSKAEE